jgi:hypothetical protein
VTAREILARAAKRDEAGKKLQAAIRRTDYGQRVVKFSVQGFAMFLGKHVDTEHDGFAFRRIKTPAPARYFLVDVAAEQKREREMREFLDKPIEASDEFREQLEKRYKKAPLRTLESTLTPRKPGRPPEPKPEPLPRKNPEFEKVRTPSQDIIEKTNETLAKATAFVLTPRYVARFLHEPSLRRYVERVKEAGFDCDVIHHNHGHAIRVNRVTRAEAEALAKRLQLGLHEIAKHAPRVMEVQPDIIPRTCAHERQLLSRGVDDHQAEAKRRWKERQRRGWWDPFSI